MHRVRADWQALIAEARTAMEAGTPPDHPGVIAMGRRRQSWVPAFSGGDPGLGRALKTACDKEPQVMAAQDMGKAMFACVREAMQAAGLKLAP